MQDDHPLQFFIKFYEDLYRFRRSDHELIQILSNLYMQVGDVKSGARMDRRQISLDPSDPIPHYNLACNLSVMGRVSEAISEFAKAVDLGYDDYQWMSDDVDLDPLRCHQQFQDIVLHRFEQV